MPVVRRSLSLLAFALGFAGLLGLARPPAAQAQDDAAGLEQMLTRINQMRSAAGMGALVRDARLDAAAQAHSTDMAASDVLEHVSPRTGDPSARVAAAGLPHVQVAENIALNADVLAVHGALVGSEAHRANLMNPALTHIGLAAARSARGVYVTQVFAVLSGAAVTPAALPPPVMMPPSEAAPATEPPTESPTAASPAAPELPGAASPTAPEPPGAPPSEELASASAAAVPALPGARRVAGYWIFSQGRWWYYPLPADARPGQVLQASSLPPGASPPGYVRQGAGGGLSVYAPPQYAPRAYLPPPAYARPPTAYYPSAGGSVYYAPGRVAGPPPFGGWSPRRTGGRWRR